MKKAFLKRTADIFEKSAIASAAASILLSFFFTYLEAKK